MRCLYSLLFYLLQYKICFWFYRLPVLQVLLNLLGINQLHWQVGVDTALGCEWHEESFFHCIIVGFQSKWFLNIFVCKFELGMKFRQALAHLPVLEGHFWHWEDWCWCITAMGSYKDGEKKKRKFCIEQFRPINIGANVKRTKVSPRKIAFISKRSKKTKQKTNKKHYFRPILKKKPLLPSK